MTTQLPGVPATERLKRPRFARLRYQLAMLSPDAWAMLDIGTRFIICLIAVGVGIRVATNGTSQLVAVLAAFGVAFVIYLLLSPKRYADES